MESGQRDLLSCLPGKINRRRILCLRYTQHRGVAKRRLRRPSSISSGSGSVTAGLAAGSVRATFSGSLPPLGIERSRQDEPRLVTVEDVKGIKLL